MHGFLINHFCIGHLDLLLPRHHHNCFTTLFPGPPGWAGARKELLDFMVQGKINRCRHIDRPAGHHSIRINQCLPPPSSIFFTGRMSFLPPIQQHQSTEGKDLLLMCICCGYSLYTSVTVEIFRQCYILVSCPTGIAAVF